MPYRRVLTTLENSLVSSRERRIIFALCVGVVLVTLVLLPFANIELPRQPAVVPFQTAIVIVTDGTTALLLFTQFGLLGAAPLLVLAGAYLFSAVMALAQFLTFPDVLTVLGLAPAVSPWLWMLWHGALPVLVLAYVLTVAFRPEARVARPPRAIVLTVLGVAAGAGLLIGGLIAVQDRLPVFFRSGDRDMTRAPWYMLLAGAEIFAAVSAVVGLLSLRRGATMLNACLSLSLVAMASEVFCAAVLTSRYTLYWYLARFEGVVGSSVVLALFLSELMRLYRRLAMALGELSNTNRLLERRVDERNLLLREVYHRVKNNLQLVDSFIVIQMACLTDAPAREAFFNLRNRVHALGLVHQQLMASDDLKTFDAAPFLRELSENIALAGGAAERGIALKIEAEAVQVELEFAISLGLLVSELAINSLKHAFPHGRGGTVRVQLSRTPAGEIVLVVADDGVGESSAAEMPGADAPKRKSGMGLQITDGLIDRLKAAMTVSRKNGTRIEVRIPALEIF
jgi:two-component sensor histidine kinase